MTSRSASRFLIGLAIAVAVLALVIFALLVFNGVVGGEEEPGSGETPAERR